MCDGTCEKIQKKPCWFAFMVRRHACAMLHTQRCQVRKNLTKHRRNQNALLNHIGQTYMALFTFSGMCHSRYLRENLRCAYCHTQPYMALSRTEHALYNYSIRCNPPMIFLLYHKVFWGNLIKNKSLYLNNIVDYLSQCQRGSGVAISTAQWILTKTVRNSLQ